MNYNEFIKAVDEKIGNMSEKEKENWIHNLARTIKEYDRQNFLSSLSSDNANDEVTYDIDEIQSWFKKVQSGEIYFECSYREVYGENHWRDYEYEYEDTFDIGEELTYAFQVAEDLLFQKKYQEAGVLYDTLIHLNVQAYDSDAEETMELSLEEIVDEKLVALDLKQIILNVIYAKYQSSPEKDKAREIYSYMKLNISKGIKLEEAFSVGPEELVGIDVFLQHWMDYLKYEEGDLAGELLFEACMLHGGIERLGVLAREMAEKHPVLYLRGCEYLMKKEDLGGCKELGLKAISLISKELIIRGRIADLTAKAAKGLGDEEVALKCYKVAFSSESTLNNCLRLIELEVPIKILRDEIVNLKTPSKRSYMQFESNNTQRVTNHISEEHKKILMFFAGELDYIYEQCKTDKTYLGWSSNIKGVIVPLFILYLDKSQGFSKVGKKLIENIKYRLNYNKDDNSFAQHFLNWKEKIKISDGEYKKYIEWLQEEVNKRTEEVVDGGFRGSYFKAAIIIAALGETIESQGSVGAKEKLIEHYKKIHSKKRAFKAEIEELK